MPLIKWDESYSVGVSEIDRQHLRLVEMINSLDDAMRKGKGKEALGKILNGLFDYVATHFKTEERYFDKFDYPDSQSHKREHREFVESVSRFKEGFEKGKLGLSIDVMSFLCDWLQKHIKETDMKFGPFLNEMGVK